MIYKLAEKKRIVKEDSLSDKEPQIVIGSWGSYAAGNKKSLGSKWLTLSKFNSWEEIEEELRREGFDLTGEDEELFIQDTHNLPKVGEYTNPKKVFEVLKASGILDNSNNKQLFDIICELRSFEDFMELYEHKGSDWSENFYVYDGYTWTDLGREVFFSNYPDLENTNFKLFADIDNYFDFEEYGLGLQFDGYELYTCNNGGIVYLGHDI